MTGPWLLAVDTATSTVVVAAGTPDGALLATETFEGRYRHSQELLPAVARLLEAAGVGLPDLAGVVAGTGPGAFTGLRVGLATAKTLAHELGVPVVGISTAEALLAGAPNGATLWLPSGPRDRVAVRHGATPVVVRSDAAGAGTEGAMDLAVDLAGRATDAALERGTRAVQGLAASLLALGARRLAAGESDDPERLVPQYASAPRGAIADQAEGAVAWSRDPR
jgi:tRNA threonylcarbamoyl adenosine modification protein YeaZ